VKHSATDFPGTPYIDLKSEQTPPIQVVVGIILNQSHLTSTTKVLLAKRQRHQAHAGLWEFPGGKVEAGETFEVALVRELQEEVGITATAWSYFDSVDIRLKQGSLHLVFYWITAFEGAASGAEGQQIKWWPVDETLTLTFPPANDPILKKIAALIKPL
jgi:8-oxo-dGTP diphosphatase